MKSIARLFLIFIILMPWAISTLSKEYLWEVASLFKFVPSSEHFYSLGTPHALEELIDFGVVLLSALVIAGISIGAESTRSAILNARARRRIRTKDRLVFLVIALLAAFPWFAPAYVLNDYSGAAVGLVSRAIDTNVIMRGIFFAILLTTAVFSILGLVFIVMGANENDR